jgi:prepilin peptidase CpaA
MEQLIGALFFIVLFGGFFDLFSRKIPNWLTFPSMGIGLACNLYLFGFQALLLGFGGILLGFALYFPIYYFGHMGAGDVKLLMVVGAWLGPKSCFYVAVVAIVLGAIYALFEVILRGRLTAVGLSLLKFFRSVLVPGLVVEMPKFDEQRKFAFGLAIAGAVALQVAMPSWRIL